MNIGVYTKVLYIIYLYVIIYYGYDRKVHRKISNYTASNLMKTSSRFIVRDLVLTKNDDDLFIGLSIFYGIIVKWNTSKTF